MRISAITTVLAIQVKERVYFDMYFGKYDMNLLEEAKKLLLKVYEYNYGEPSMRSKVKRLETIISKIEVLQQTNENKEQ